MRERRRRKTAPPFPRAGGPSRRPSASGAIEMGADIAVSPHLRRDRITGVRQLGDPGGQPLLDPGAPSQASLPKQNPRPKTGSCPSTALLGLVPPCAPPVPGGTAFHAGRVPLFRRLFRRSDLEPGFLLIAIRWRSGLPSSPSLPAVAGPPGRRGLPSRSQVQADLKK